MMLILCALTLIGKTVYILLSLSTGLFQIVAGKVFKYKNTNHRFSLGCCSEPSFPKVMKFISTSK